MTQAGFFISFEGIDGAGKSTHIENLAQAFERSGREVVLTREPGGTPVAEAVRQLLLNQGMDALTEALLVFAGRRDHVQQVIDPALQRGAVVLCDRFTDATFAYQGAGRGVDTQVLQQLERWVQSLREDAQVLQPDLTLWFDLPAATAAQRLAGARMPDRFESQPQAFFEQVRQGYAARMAADPTRFVRLDAALSREAVWSSALAAVQGRGWLAS